MSPRRFGARFSDVEFFQVQKVRNKQLFSVSVSFCTILFKRKLNGKAIPICICKLYLFTIIYYITIKV